MKKIMAFLFIVFLAVSCSEEPEDSISVELAVIGDSITMGIQSAGLTRDFQENAYPYLIAGRMGFAEDFEQPWIETDAGMPPFSEPVSYDPDTGVITAPFGELTLGNDVNLLELFPNYMLDRAYNNLGIGGAQLLDVRKTVTPAESQRPGNLLFSFVLRNRGTMMDEVKSINPEIIILWIGANDVLNSVSSGTSTGMTETGVFEDEYRNIMDDLVKTGAHIILGKIPSYLPFVTALDEWKQVSSWYYPDISDITATNTETPLFMEEDDVEHLLLYGLFRMEEDHDAGGNLGLIDDDENRLPGEYTLTADEYDAVSARIEAFNEIIGTIAGEYGGDNSVTVVDVSSFWLENPGDGNDKYSGYSGKYVLADADTTYFSLDGVHPNNLGQAMIANAFIDAINSLAEYQENQVSKLDVSTFAGQYSGN